MKTLVRYVVSVALGFALVLPFVHFPLAQAVSTTPLTSDDLLDPEFGSATGLGQSDLETTVGSLIRVGLGFLGVIAVVIILFGGFKWMTAGGNDKSVAEAKSLIVAGIIGLAIILSAYAIASFVISSIVTATNG